MADVSSEDVLPGGQNVLLLKWDDLKILGTPKDMR